MMPYVCSFNTSASWERWEKTHRLTLQFCWESFNFDVDSQWPKRTPVFFTVLLTAQWFLQDSAHASKHRKGAKRTDEFRSFGFLDSFGLMLFLSQKITWRAKLPVFVAKKFHAK